MRAMRNHSSSDAGLYANAIECSHVARSCKTKDVQPSTSEGIVAIMPPCDLLTLQSPSTHTYLTASAIAPRLCASLRASLRASLPNRLRMSAMSSSPLEISCLAARRGSAPFEAARRPRPQGRGINKQSRSCKDMGRLRRLVATAWFVTIAVDGFSSTASRSVLPARGLVRPHATSVAEWRKACDSRGVVSFHDFGVRLQAPSSASVVEESKTAKAAYAAREVGKYAASTGAQFGLFMAAFSFIDAAPFGLPKPAVWCLFCFLSLRSRIFSLLDNSRPDRDKMAGKATPVDVRRPKWTPPGIAFPFIWLTITGLRATAAALAYRGNLRSEALEAPSFILIKLPFQ